MNQWEGWGRQNKFRLSPEANDKRREERKAAFLKALVPFVRKKIAEDPNFTNITKDSLIELQKEHPELFVGFRSVLSITEYFEGGLGGIRERVGLPRKMPAVKNTVSDK